MRALVLALLVVVPSLAGEEDSLSKAVELFRSKDAAARDKEETARVARQVFPMPQQFGIEVIAFSSTVNHVQTRGLLVRRVHEKSKAAVLGLRRGDHILEVNGKEVTTFEDLRCALGKKAVWGKIKCRVLRAGRQVDLTFVR